MSDIAYIAQSLSTLDRSVELYESLLERFPKHEVTKENQFVLANLYASQTKFELAAPMFQRFAVENSKTTTIETEKDSLKKQDYKGKKL